MRQVTRAAAVAGSVLALGASGVLAAGTAGAADTATVSILHAVPGLNVDVYANGDLLLENFKPGTLTDPLKLPAGEYDLAVFKAGDPSTGTPAIKADDVTVPAGANATVVAHLDADGTPVLTPFVNDVSKIAAGKTRLTVRHTAAAPAVDVRAGGTPVFSDLTNPNEATADIAAGTVKADVTLAGTDTVAIGPADLTLPEGTSTIVYAWGSAADKNLDLAVQTISGLHSSPSGVPSGSGGLVDDSLPLGVLALTLVGAGSVALGGRRLVAARR